MEEMEGAAIPPQQSDDYHVAKEKLLEEIDQLKIEKEEQVEENRTLNVQEEEEEEKEKHSEDTGKKIKKRNRKRGSRKRQHGGKDEVDPTPSRVDIGSLNQHMMKQIYVFGKVLSVKLKRENGLKVVVGRIIDNSGGVNFKATGTDVTKLKVGSFFKLANCTTKLVNNSIMLESVGDIITITPEKRDFEQLEPNIENFYAHARVMHVTHRHEMGLLIAEGRLADFTAVVDFIVVGEIAAQIKAESVVGLKNAITEMDNGKMRVRAVGEIEKLEDDPSMVAAMYKANEANDMSQPGRFS